MDAITSLISFSDLRPKFGVRSISASVFSFFGIWKYPDQLGAWSVVHIGKWSSWSLLVIMTFTIVAHLKHIKSRIHVPE